MLDDFDIQIQYDNADPVRAGVTLPDGTEPSGTKQREGLFSTTNRTSGSIRIGHRPPSGGGTDPGGTVRFIRLLRTLVGHAATLITTFGGVSP